MTTENYQTEAEVIRDTTGAALQPREAEGDYALLPAGYSVHDHEQYRGRPDRIRQARQIATEASFIEYISRWQPGGSPELLACRESLYLHCTLDGHSSDDAGQWVPSWCEHSARYNCPLDRRWEAWTGRDRHKFTQVGFAEWIEDHHEDFAEPAASDLLDLAVNLQIHRNAAFSSQVQLASGEFNFSFSETNASGTVAVPAEIAIAVPVFVDGVVYKVRARLRYRLTEGALGIWYELIEPERYVDDAFGEVVSSVETETELTAIKVLANG